MYDISKQNNQIENISEVTNNINNNENESKKTNKNKKKSKFVHLKDFSYDIFNAIFNNIEFNNIKNKKIKIKDFQDFIDFQKNLNSYYKPKIRTADYKHLNKISILKENPYKPIKLRKISEEDTAITISPNGMFATTSNHKSDLITSLAHYYNIIGNAVIIKGVYYYEIQILQLGDNFDLYFGIISKDSIFFKKDEYKHYPIGCFEDAYAINLNEQNEIDFWYEKKYIKEGDIITVKIDLNDYYIKFFINELNFKSNEISIKAENNSYFPAFSLSGNKEIRVNFGGIFDINYCFNDGNKLDAISIFQLNNLDKIMSCYMTIIENHIIKIMNFQQISYNDSIRFFYPMFNFIGNIALKDEYIVKNYILKFMYEKYEDVNTDIYQYFKKRYNFVYLIIQNINEKMKQNLVLFLLDCLAEEIKHQSFIDINSDNSFENWHKLVNLYNFFLQRKLILDILFEKDNRDDINKKLKNQLLIIFQPTKIFGFSEDELNNHYTKSNIIIENFQKKNNAKYILFSFKELINTLLSPILEYPEYNLNEFDELVSKKFEKENTFSEINNDTENEYNNSFKVEEKQYNQLWKFLLPKKMSVISNREDDDNNIKIVNEDNYNSNDSNYESIDEDNIIKLKRKIKSNHYRSIFFSLINEVMNSKSKHEKYNFIITILFPTFFLFNDAYEKDSSSDLTNSQILSFIPLASETLLEINHETFIRTEFLKNNKFYELIKPGILSFELYRKKYNISSFLLKLIINFLSFINSKDIFEDIKECYFEINDINKNKIELNQSIRNFQNLLLFINKNFYDTISKTINILISYFNDLINNNLFVLLPICIINGIMFFIKYIYMFSIIYEKDEIFHEDKLENLVNLLMNLNKKILNVKYISKSAIYEVFYEIEVLFGTIDDIRDECGEEDINLEIYFNEDYFNTLFKSIDKFYNQADKKMKKLFYFFVINFYLGVGDNEQSCDNRYYYLLNYIENDKKDFILNTFILKKCIRKNILKKILKVEKILEIIKDDNIIDKNLITKLEKYFKSLILSMRFISKIINEEKVIDKFFNNKIQRTKFEKKLEESKSNILHKNDEEIPIYYCLIKIVSLITTKLLNENFFMLFNKKFSLKYNLLLFLTCVNFCKNIIMIFPKSFEDKLNKEKEKERNKKQKKKTNKQKDKNTEGEEGNEKLKKYYIYAFNHINKNDFAKIIIIIERRGIFGINTANESHILKELISFLNDIQNKYNTRIIDSKEEKEDNLLCPICFVNNSDCHVSPCGHKLCWECIQKLNNDICPICRAKMTDVLEHPNFKFKHNVPFNHRPEMLNILIPLINPFLRNEGSNVFINGVNNNNSRNNNLSTNNMNNNSNNSTSIFPPS